MARTTFWRRPRPGNLERLVQDFWILKIGARLEQNGVRSSKHNSIFEKLIFAKQTFKYIHQNTSSTVIEKLLESELINVFSHPSFML